MRRLGCRAATPECQRRRRRERWRAFPRSQRRGATRSSTTLYRVRRRQPTPELRPAGQPRRVRAHAGTTTLSHRQHWRHRAMTSSSPSSGLPRSSTRGSLPSTCATMFISLPSRSTSSQPSRWCMRQFSWTESRRHARRPSSAAQRASHRPPNYPRLGPRALRRALLIAREGEAAHPVLSFMRSRAPRVRPRLRRPPTHTVTCAR
mmetsp:Transcript_12138/g.31759  ORF Transcript_12138/g.31759 Transcript_12138/m.31759 type:complete len:205 (-) Transcript_12138:284-898(-)